MSVQSINSEIIAGNLTNDELTSIIDAVKFARARLADKTKYTIGIGSNVQFTDPRTNRTYKGVVKKIKIKNILIDCPTYGRGGLLNVPANMLSPA